MNNLTVRTKLLAAFGGVLIILLFIAGFAATLLSKENERFETYINGINARALMAARVRAAVDLRAISARNLVLVTQPEDVAMEKQSVVSAHADATKSLAQLVKMAQTIDVPDDVRKMIAEIDRIEQSYAPVALNIVDLALSGHHDEAIKKMNNDCRPLLAKLIKATEDYAQFTAERSTKQVSDARQAYTQNRNVLIASSILAGILALTAGFLIERSLHHDLGSEPSELRKLVGEVADGDLTRPIAVVSGDNHSILAAVSRMQISLVRIVSTVRKEAEEVSNASAKISRGNAELSSRTESQASSLEQTAASLEQFGSTVHQNTDNAIVDPESETVV